MENILSIIFSQPHVPPVSVLRDMKGKLITELERADISKTAGYRLETG